MTRHAAAISRHMAAVACQLAMYRHAQARDDADVIMASNWHHSAAISVQLSFQIKLSLFYAKSIAQPGLLSMGAYYMIAWASAGA